MSEFDNFWGVIWLFNEKMTQTDASAKKSSQMWFANTASVWSQEGVNPVQKDIIAERNYQTKKMLRCERLCWGNKEQTDEIFFSLFFFLFWAVFFVSGSEEDVAMWAPVLRKQRTNSGNMVINRTGRQERRATGKKVEIIISVKTVLERSARPQKMVAFEPGPAVRWAGWACWRFMKRWKFEKSSFFILGTKGLGREGRSALFPPPVITQTVGGTNIINLGFLVPCELLSYTFQRGQIKQVIRFRLTAISPSNQGKQRSCLDPCELCKREVEDHSSFQTPSHRRCTRG